MTTDTLPAPWSRDWRLDAACRGTPITMWYPERGTADVSAARAICAGCPVRGPCLEAALDEDRITPVLHYADTKGADRLTREGYGIRGGMTPTERRKERARRRGRGAG